MKLAVKWSPKKTCWWVNDWHPRRRGNYRNDKIFSLDRVWVRALRVYIYVLTIGRMKMSLYTWK